MSSAVVNNYKCFHYLSGLSDVTFNAVLVEDGNITLLSILLGHPRWEWDWHLLQLNAKDENIYLIFIFQTAARKREKKRLFSLHLLKFLKFLKGFFKDSAIFSLMPFLLEQPLILGQLTEQNLDCILFAKWIFISLKYTLTGCLHRSC